MDCALSPRAAYIHVPFCRHRCGYCNFTLVAGRDDLIPAYLDAIARELVHDGPPQPVDTLYFGGGTPSQLNGQQFAQLARSVLARHPLADGGEWTVEANPADINDQWIDMLAQLGVTRLSLGGQSFRDDKLELLERDHRGDDIVRSVKLAHSAGLAVALDLIFATPGETLDQWRTDLVWAIELRPEHISTYGLTFERGTQFWSRLQRDELHQADDRLERAMFEQAIRQLIAAGFEHYEVSNFAQPGQRSRHNQVYWSGDSYFAAGPGAARFLDGVRETNHRSTTTYLRRVLAGQSPVAEREQLSPEARARELLVIGLRRLAGVERVGFAARTGYQIDQLIAEPLARFIAMGLLYDDGVCVRLTHSGLIVSDAIWPEFL